MLILLWSLLTDDEKEIVNDLFTEYHLKLYRISFQILRSHSDAEDALSQTFIKIMNNIDKIKKISRHEMLPFCIVIIKNASFDILRKKSKLLTIDYLEVIEEFPSETVEESFFENQNKEMLLRLIDKLSPDERFLIELRFGENMSYKEIEAIMNITEATARKRVQRTLGKLQYWYLEEGYVNV